MSKAQKNNSTEPELVPFFFVALSFFLSMSGVSSAGGQDIESQVATILSQRCVECHNSQNAKGNLDLSLKEFAFKGGESGKAIVPSRLDESLLWQKISEGEMPPESAGSLSNDERDTIKKWIQSGAKWTSTNRLNQFQYSTDHRAGLDWWSLKPIRRPEIPKSQSSHLSHPIDRFVDRKLRSAGLRFSAKADKQKIYRRLCFDLLGIPPDPDQVDAYTASSSDDAYEQLVDRLLGSPRYGERWGRHWLDVAHYADTHGYERDQRRLHAWRYRDFVIQSFNDDQPYDEFVKYQIAGDVLDPDNRDANIATGFLACGPYDFTGIEETLSDKLRRQAMADDLDDMITTVLTSTMGLTINCARCHDHKFDPITQKDYYEFSALFANVTKKNRVTVNLNQFHASKQQKEKLKSEIAKIDQAIKNLDKTFDLADVVAGGDGRGNAPGGLGLDPRTGLFIKGNIGSVANVKVNTFVRGLSRFVDGCFIPGGSDDAEANVPVSSSGIKIKLPKTSGACWDYFQKGPCNSQDFTDLDEVDYNESGHSLLSIHSNKGITFDLKEIRQSLGFEKLRFTSVMGFGGKHLGSSADVYIFVDGKNVFERQHVGRRTGGIPIDLKLDSSTRFLTLVVTDDQNGIGHDQIFFGDAWLRDGAKKSNQATKQLAELNRRRQELHRQLLAIEEPKDLVFAAVQRDRKVQTHLLVRGNPETKGSIVLPAGLSCISNLDGDLGDLASSDGQRRKRVAHWIANKENPLFARVLVNRLWHYHFGQGLVNTPSDFGFLGDRPSHPELLDWLASELIDSDWSIKHIQRLIVTSHVYRQESLAKPQAKKVDADNRLLWRMNPKRLESEAIRDAVLATSGTLNLSGGGPGYQDFEYIDKYAPVYKFTTADRPELWKRTVYRFTVRSVPDRFMKVLDCPNPSSLTPARSQTTTALQSLSLLNNPFMVDQSRYFSERIASAESVPAKQVELAFRLAFARRPSPDEKQAALQLVDEHGLFYFCRALLNANEFIYLD